MPVADDRDLIKKREYARQPDDTPVARSLKILELIAGQSRGWTISQLSKELAIPKSTISYLVKLMVACDHLRENKKYYSLGYRFLDLVRLSTGSEGLEMELRETARPYLQRIAKSTKLGANLGVLDQRTAVYIDRVPPPKPAKPGLIRIDITPGLRIAPHVTAIGKALICHLDPDRIEEIWESNRNYKGPLNAIKSLDALNSELELTRRRGYATDRGEHDPNVHCVAVPVFAADNKVVAAISVNGTPELLGDDKLKKDAHIIQQEVKSLSEYLTNRKWSR